MKELSVKSFDGMSIKTYASVEGKGRAALFVNANWTLHGLTDSLSKYFVGNGVDFVTFDTRGMYLEDSITGRSISPDAIAMDIISIVEHYGLKEVSLIGYCNGCQNGLKACLIAPQYFKKAILLNGGYGIKDGKKMPARKMLDSILPVVGRDLNKSKFYSKMFNVDDLVKGIDISPDVAEIVSYPFMHGEEVLHRYGRAFIGMMEDNFDDWARRVETPCISIASELDHMEHPDQIRRVSSWLRNSKYIFMPDLDHYAITRDPSLHQFILDETIN